MVGAADGCAGVGAEAEPAAEVGPQDPVGVHPGPDGEEPVDVGYMARNVPGDSRESLAR